MATADCSLPCDPTGSSKEIETVAVVTDSCASIPQELVTPLRVEIVPYYVDYAGRTWRDGIDVVPEDFFAWMSNSEVPPTSANPGPGDYLKAFATVAQWATHIAVPTMTSVGSGAYQAACIAREMAVARLPQLTIEVIDTRQTAMVHGWAAIEGARAAMRGENFARTLSIIRYVAATGHMIQTADTLRYLYLGGRIGRAKHLIGTLLNVKPLIGMEDGVIVALGQARSLKLAYAKMVDIMAAYGAALRPIKLCVTHTVAPDRANQLLAQVTQAFTCDEVLIASLSPALGVHTGPGLVGVNFFPVADD